MFERLFKEFGLPRAIRTDNGVPFASPNALYKLSRLAVWWLRLGIEIERIKPGRPQQQARFDDFIAYFNDERPHQGLDMAPPAERYEENTRSCRGLPEIDCPFHDKTVTVTKCGRICVRRKKENRSTVFAGQKVGIRQVEDRIWRASFMAYDLG